MKASIPTASVRRICRVLSVSRSTLYALAAGSSLTTKTGVARDDELSARIHVLIQQHPTFGYRRIWALLRFGDKLVINRKRVYRIMRRKRWLVCQRTVTSKPRVRKRKSVAATRNERWAMDVTHIAVGRDGWAHLTAVIVTIGNWWGTSSRCVGEQRRQSGHWKQHALHDLELSDRREQRQSYAATTG